MSREDRDIVLEGPMPVSLAGINSEDRVIAFLSDHTWLQAMEYRGHHSAITEVIKACEAEFEEFGYLPKENDSFDDVWAALAAFRQVRADVSCRERDRVYERETAAQDERAELGRQERERFRLHHDVEQLVSGLLGYGVQQGIVISVLHGDTHAINTAATRVREVARSRETSGLAPANSHSRLLTLLRRSNAPGSDEAQQFLREWPQSTDREQLARATEAVIADNLIWRAQAGERVSTGVILERLGIAAPSSLEPPPPLSLGVTRLGQAVDLPNRDDQRRLQQDRPRDQMEVKSAFKTALFDFLRAYSGDLTYATSTFSAYVLDYGRVATTRDQDDLGQTLARSMIETAADISTVPIDTLIPSRLRSDQSSSLEQGNENAGQEENTPTGLLGEPVDTGSILGRNGGELDGTANSDPSNPSIIRL